MRTLIGVLALSLAGVAGTSQAQNVVITPQTAGTAELVNGLWNVSITAGGSPDVFVTVQGSASPSIRYIDITSTGSANTYVELDVRGVSSVYSIRRNAASSGKAYLSYLRATGDVWEVNLNQVGEIDADLDIEGPITLSGGRAVTGAPGIRVLNSRTGDITGNITVNHGGNIDEAIRSIEAVQGTIGTPSVPIAISSRGPVGSIVAGGVYANVNTFQTTIGTLKATGESNNTGDFVGSLSASTILSQEDWPIDVLGNLDANITFTQTLSHGIRVGKSFLAGRTISVPQNGLHPSAQIVFNDRNLNPAGQWLGTVSVGTSALFPIPDYTNPPYELGPVSLNDGGSIGLAEFRFHEEGCVPPHGTSLNIGGICQTCPQEPPPCIPSQPSLSHVLLRHHGPIEINDSVGTFPNTRVYKVEYSLVGPPYGTYGDVSNDYKVNTSPPNDVTIAGRVAKVERNDGQPFAVGHYRITLMEDTQNPGTTRLRSKISGNGAFVPGYWYGFAIIVDCENARDELYDINRDSWINANDIGAWLNEPSDLNEDNAVTGADLNRIVIGVATYGN